MSWETFRRNILNVADNPDGIPDIDIIAELYATEYDAAIKRGGDVINNVSIKRGNVQAMKQFFRAALEKGVNSKAPYDLVGEMGQGVLAYWAGAELNQYPIPKIPAKGATQNIAVISNIVTNAGSWQPIVHADPPPPTPEDFKLTQEQKEVKTQELAEAIQSDDETATDYVAKLQEELASDYNLSIEQSAEKITKPRPRFKPKEYAPKGQGNIQNMTDDNYTNLSTDFTTGELGARIVQVAKTDIGIAESKNTAGAFADCGGKKSPTGNGALPFGEFGRIDYMIKLNGLNNAAEIAKKGSGYWWCACAVGTWWKEAGVNPKDLDFWIPYVPNWPVWAKKKGLWSATPAVGAAIIYNGKRPYCHIGIVASVVNGVVTTIEGNTSGKLDGKVYHNGMGCFVRTPNLGRVAGYVLPPGTVPAK